MSQAWPVSYSCLVRCNLLTPSLIPFPLLRSEEVEESELNQAPFPSCQSLSLGELGGPSVEPQEHLALSTEPPHFIGKETDQTSENPSPLTASCSFTIPCVGFLSSSLWPSSEIPEI